MLLINENNIFNEEYLKNKEMIPYENHQEETLYIEKNTFKHFELLQEHLRVEGIEIDLIEGYKSLEYVENEFCHYMQKYGLDQATKSCDMPGFSDFHTGEAITFIIKKNQTWLTKEETLKETKTLNKIHKIIPLFGFIIRYPKNKEQYTKHPYNPLHLRFIGRENVIKIKKLSLEEYYQKNE